MIDILFGDNSYTLRFEVPPDWATPSGVNITVTRDTGTEVVASTAATLGFTASTLSSATTRGATTIVTAADISLSPGDRLRIAASASGPAEDCEVEFYASATKTATLKRELNHAHASGAAVSPLWATKAIDASTEADYPLGGKYLIQWVNANADDIPATEYAEVVKRKMQILGFEQDFALRFRDLHEVIRKRWAAFERATYDMMRAEWLAEGRKFDRFVDQSRGMEYAIQTLRRIVVDTHGDQWAAEREPAMKAAKEALRITLNTENWSDDDQDLVVEEEEVATSTTHYSARNY